MKQSAYMYSCSCTKVNRWVKVGSLLIHLLLTTNEMISLFWIDNHKCSCLNTQAMPPSIDAGQGKAKARDGLDIASLPREV